MKGSALLLRRASRGLLPSSDLKLATSDFQA